MQAISESGRAFAKSNGVALVMRLRSGVINDEAEISLGCKVALTGNDDGGVVVVTAPRAAVFPTIAAGMAVKGVSATLEGTIVMYKSGP